jgi:hypothetical protein
MRSSTPAFKTGASAATAAVELSGADDGATLKLLRKNHSVKPGTGSRWFGLLKNSIRSRSRPVHCPTKTLRVPAQAMELLLW